MEKLSFKYRIGDKKFHRTPYHIDIPVEIVGYAIRQNIPFYDVMNRNSESKFITTIRESELL